MAKTITAYIQNKREGIHERVSVLGVLPKLKNKQLNMDNINTTFEDDIYAFCCVHGATCVTFYIVNK